MCVYEWKLSFSKSIPSFSDPSNELVAHCEVSSSSSLATNALSSSNCKPTETWLWDMLLVCICVVSCTTLGSFSFNILIFSLSQMAYFGSREVIHKDINGIKCESWYARYIFSSSLFACAFNVLDHLQRILSSKCIRGRCVIPMDHNWLKLIALFILHYLKKLSNPIWMVKLVIPR